MAVLYTTVAKEARAEQIIERSRFIATIKPVQSRAEAEAFFKSVREEFRDATHNVPAFVLGERMQDQWGSDDGEPGGTAGTPIAAYLAKEGVTNVAIVVTRYFGGIKLGTGGLVRAYTSSARLAVQAAGKLDVCLRVELETQIDYSMLGKVKNYELSMPFKIEDLGYTDVVKLRISFAPEDEGSIMAMLSDLCSGDVKIISRVSNY